MVTSKFAKKRVNMGVATCVLRQTLFAVARLRQTLGGLTPEGETWPLVFPHTTRKRQLDPEARTVCGIPSGMQFSHWAGIFTLNQQP